MARLFIGANMGPPEGPKTYTEIPVTELSQKALSYHLGCTVEDLIQIEHKMAIPRVEKSVGDSQKMATFYRVEDFPKIVSGLQSLAIAQKLNFLKGIDTTKGNFEIVYESGSKLRFEKN